MVNQAKPKTGATTDSQHTMANSLRNVKNVLQTVAGINRQQVRFKMFWPRAIIEEEEKTFAQRQAEMNRKDPELDKVINIGFPMPKMDRTERRKRENALKKLRSDTETKAELEKTARQRTLKIPLDEVKEMYQQEMKSYHWKSIAEHYGIFRDLFDNAIFYPLVNMDISYDYDDEYVSKVYIGNRLKPSEVKSVPNVEYTAEPDTWWTLSMTAPDSHLQDNNKEYLHWLVGNIPGGDVNKGEQLCNYLPPFPVIGTGYHRYVFVLYKQEGKLDFSKEKRPEQCVSLQQRTFSTLEFYRDLQDKLTPASLHMFQSDWDESVRDTFWHTLDMKEPRFDFIHPPPYHPKQKWYPHKQPFNLYLDRYRDIKDINEEVFREKMKNMKPLEIPQPAPKYPILNLKYFSKKDERPSWLKLKLKHKYLEEMQWKETDEMKN